MLYRVRPGIIDGILAWLTDHPWYGAVTACLPLALGIVIGINSVEEPRYVLEQDEEIALLAVSGNAAWISEITDEE